MHLFEIYSRSFKLAQLKICVSSYLFPIWLDYFHGTIIIMKIRAKTSLDDDKARVSRYFEFQYDTIWLYEVTG